MIFYCFNIFEITVQEAEFEVYIPPHRPYLFSKFVDFEH